jgi:tetratricopeptide (TPR) repeat protein
MATLESAARIIHRPESPANQTAPASPAVPTSRQPETESRTDLFTQEELFGVKKGRYIKKARSRVLADIESLSGNCRWQDIVSLYHPVEEKVPELDQADMVKEKIAFAMGHLKQFDDAISLLQACISNNPDNFYTRSSLAYTAYSSLFAARNKEIFLAGAPRARRIELAHENFTRARELRPDGVTNCYRHAMLYLQIQNNPKPALHLLNQAVANWENLSEQEQSRRHQEKKNYVKSLYRSASILLENGEASRALERIQTCLKQDEKSNHLSLCFKYFALGKIQFCREQYSRAGEALRFALQSREKNQPVDFVHELLARTCLAQGRIDQARETIDQVPVKMRRPYFRWTEADVLCAAGRFDRAVQVLTETADRDSRSKHIALLRLTKICYNQGQFEAGADHAGRAVNFFREKWGNPYYEGLFWQALCAFKAGRRQQAETLVTELERECPHFPKLNRLAAMIREK